MSAPFPKVVCDTLDCGGEVTREVSWPGSAGGTVTGYFCESCAWKLNCANDDVRPPFEARVIQFPRGAR